MNTDFITPADPRWAACLEEIPHDVYHLPEYLTFTSRFEDGTPLAFYASDDDGCCLIPLLVRPLPESLQVPSVWQDATSPYGYPSPLVSPVTPENVLKYLNAFVEAARSVNLVSVFLRLNPLFDLPLQAMQSIGAVVNHGPTVMIDLTKPDAEIWKETRPAHKRQINKLLKSGFHAVMDDWRYYDDFIRIYATTMTRVEASTFYFFDHEYFTEMKACLTDHLHLCTVLSPEGRVAAAGLFTCCGNIIQYHLSGAAKDFLPLAPTKLLLDTVRRWGAASAASCFHLGGGRGARQDSLFEFKQGFSNCVKQFYTFRLVIDHNKYADCVQSRLAIKPIQKDDLFFPPYRS